MVPTPWLFDPLSYNLVRESIVLFSFGISYGNGKSLTALKVLCKQCVLLYYSLDYHVMLEMSAKLLRSYNFGKFVKNLM